MRRASLILANARLSLERAREALISGTKLWSVAFLPLSQMWFKACYTSTVSIYLSRKVDSGNHTSLVQRSSGLGLMRRRMKSLASSLTSFQ